jgi:hypothetical protein
MEDNLDCLVISWILFIYIYAYTYSYLMNFIHLYLCIYVYVDVIVDITARLITLNQISKSDKYHKNKHSSV